MESGVVRNICHLIMWCECLFNRATKTTTTASAARTEEHHCVHQNTSRLLNSPPKYECSSLWHFVSKSIQCTNSYLPLKTMRVKLLKKMRTKYINSNEQQQPTPTHTERIRIYYLDEWHLTSAEKHPMCAIKMKSRTGPDCTEYSRTEETHAAAHWFEVRKPTQTVRCACLSNYIIDFDISCTVESQNGH